MVSEEKLTVLLPLKISDKMNGDLLEMVGRPRKRAEYARIAIEEKMERSRHEKMPKVLPAEAKALAECHALNIDPIPYLQAAITDAAVESSIKPAPAAQPLPVAHVRP